MRKRITGCPWRVRLRSSFPRPLPLLLGSCHPPPPLLYLPPLPVPGLHHRILEEHAHIALNTTCGHFTRAVSTFCMSSMPWKVFDALTSA